MAVAARAFESQRKKSKCWTASPSFLVAAFRQDGLRLRGRDSVRGCLRPCRRATRTSERAGSPPTVRTCVEALTYGSLKLLVWDIGGQERVRIMLWRQHLNAADALIFVVDSGDLQRLAEAREEMRRILTNEVAPLAEVRGSEGLSPNRGIVWRACAPFPDMGRSHGLATPCRVRARPAEVRLALPGLGRHGRESVGRNRGMGAPTAGSGRSTSWRTLVGTHVQALAWSAA